MRRALTSSRRPLWYDAICSILAKHAYPHGGIVAAQVDNEMAYFFGVNAYSGDYSDASIAGYRTFLLDKYGDLANLNSVYSGDYDDIGEVQPPRRFAATSKKDIP